MITDKIKALAKTKAKVLELEQAIATELNRSLAALPARYGFDSVQGFVAAVKKASGGKREKQAAKKPSGKKRRRAVITDATRNAVKKLVEAKKTGGEIAKELKISLPSVQNIKKALGLVKSKKK